MSGVAIIRHLLQADSSLTAVVPATRIRAGFLPLNTDLPAIAVTKISAQQLNTLAMNSANYLVTERVQVTIITDVYAQSKSILELVVAACPLTRGSVNGFTCESVMPDSEGPELYDEKLNIFSESQDFQVSFYR